MVVVERTQTRGAIGELSRLTALHRAGIAVARQRDLADVTAAIVRELGQTLGYHFVSVYLWDGAIMRLQAQRGYATPAETIPPHIGVIGRVFRTGTGAWVTDPTADPDFFYADTGVCSQVAVPVTDREERVCGVVSVESAATLDAGDYELLGLFAQQIGIAIGNAQLHATLVRAARTDALTGILNRAALLDGIEGMLTEAETSHRPLALLFADVDHFKALNDRHGHQAGDRVLRKCAERVAALLPAGSLLGRYGGEEFVILVSSGACRATMALADRLRRAIAEVAVADVPGEDATRVTISIGVARYPRDGASGVALLRAADRALYAAKSAGRNRVCRA